MKIKRFNESNKVNESIDDGSNVYLISWNEPMNMEIQPSPLHVYDDQWLSDHIDEIFEGEPETFDKVLNLNVGEKLTNSGKQVLNGYIDWIQKIPFN